MSKDCLAACPASAMPTEDFDKTDIICPGRDHAIEKLAIEKALGPNPDVDDGLPSLKSLGIRAVRVSFYSYLCLMQPTNNKPTECI